MKTDDCRLPVGVENFEDFRSGNFYYVDKTLMIRDLVENAGKVTLFTRPRRFGKTLNMSMLKCFFDLNSDRKVFDNLAIMREKDICEKYQGQYPVISLSMKNIGGITFQEAVENMGDMLQETARKFQFLLNSTALTEIDKMPLRKLLESEPSARVQRGSIRLLSEMLYRHYGRKTVILIDEYDVPLDKAYENGYYDKMVSHMRSVLGQALKTNDYLELAVLTGCMRISRESIFTGLNNFAVYTVSDMQFTEYFGFTNDEVKKLLYDYGLESGYSLIREWYDGYRFGNTEIYCPWDVLNYCSRLLNNPDEKPAAYWANTSGNAIIRQVVEQASATVKNDIETLLAGNPVKMRLVPELTYKDLETDNQEELNTYLWTLLFTTGYLTDREKPEEEIHTLGIPNLEIHQIFENQIRQWFSAMVRRNPADLHNFCLAVQNGDAIKAEKFFTAYLQKTIGIQDTRVRRSVKENFYHGILLGLLSSEADWIVRSNPEAGDGYSDIMIEIPDKKTGIIIEVKYAADGNPEAECVKALDQIPDRNYAAGFQYDDVDIIHGYGIACFKKKCKIQYMRIK